MTPEKLNDSHQKITINGFDHEELYGNPAEALIMTQLINGNFRTYVN